MQFSPDWISRELTDVRKEKMDGTVLKICLKEGQAHSKTYTILSKSQAEEKVLTRNS